MTDDSYNDSHKIRTKKNQSRHNQFNSNLAYNGFNQTIDQDNKFMTISGCNP